MSKFVITNKHIYFYTIPLFTYGFLREFRGEFSESDNLFGKKFISSTINGFAYIIPPYNLFKLYRFVNRVDIKLNEKDPQKYEEQYNETISKNKNVFL